MNVEPPYISVTTLTLKDVQEAATAVAKEIALLFLKDHILQLYGVPRGGIPAALLVQNALINLGVPSVLIDDPGKAEVIIDDLIDSGRTRQRYREHFPNAIFAPLYYKQPGDHWLVFPWERSTSESAEDIPLRLLQYIGEDPKREGLRETPRRYLEAWADWTSGYAEKPEDILKVFSDGADQYHEMVLVKDIPVISHCEHHLAMMWGVAHVAYIPDGSIVGLSKLARVVNVFARRLQVQERMTRQIAEAIQNNLKALGVGVVLECRHACMEARGVRVPGTTTTTSCLLGAFKEKPETRAEFLRLVR